MAREIKVKYPVIILWYNISDWIFNTEVYSLEALELAQKIAEVASDKQGRDVLLLDTREVCGFADFFVICSGESSRQLQAIYEEIGHVLKKDGILPRRREGTLDSGWLLLDYGDVIVHIFAPFEREYYKLDDLWSLAKPLVRIQ